MTYLRFGFSTIAAAGLFLGLSLAVTPAGAQGRPQINPEQACKNDAFRFCNDLIPDRGKVGACLRRNARALSPDCRTIVAGGPHRAARRHAGRHHRRHG
jgi:hypothetical protein